MLQEQDALKYQIVINFSDKTKLFNTNIPVPMHSEKKINTVEVITLGLNVTGKVLSNVKFRNEHIPTGKIISYDLVERSSEDPAGSIKTLQYVPEGTYMTVLARTKNKFKVANWGNYWYYVELSSGYQSIKTGWMFGEFVAVEGKQGIK